MADVKSFRFDDTLKDLIKELKDFYEVENDSDVLKKTLLDAKRIKENFYIKADDCHNLEKRLQEEIKNKETFIQEKDKEIRRLYLKLGEVQGELNTYKQIYLPKKENKEKKWWQFWKRYSTDTERAGVNEVIKTDKDKFN